MNFTIMADDDRILSTPSDILFAIEAALEDTFGCSNQGSTSLSSHSSLDNLLVCSILELLSGTLSPDARVFTGEGTAQVPFSGM